MIEAGRAERLRLQAVTNDTRVAAMRRVLATARAVGCGYGKWQGLWTVAWLWQGLTLRQGQGQGLKLRQGQELQLRLVGAVAIYIRQGQGLQLQLLLMNLAVIRCNGRQ
jgi:hypothetical protein